MDNNKGTQIDIFNQMILDMFGFKVEYISIRCSTPGCGNIWGMHPVDSKVSTFNLICKDCQRRLKENRP